jgi:hypothetical protein
MSIDLTSLPFAPGTTLKGEWPHALQPAQNPLLVLLRKHWTERGTDRLTAARTLSTSVHLGKTCNRIDELLCGRVFRQHWFDKLVDYLEIPAEERLTAQHDTGRWQEQCWHWRRRSKRLRAFARYGPYVLALAKPDYYPSLLGLTGDGRFIIAIPTDVLGCPESPNLSAIMNWLREMPAQRYKPGICAGFLVHLNLDEIHFSNHQGQILKSGPADTPVPDGFKEFFFGG